MAYLTSRLYLSGMKYTALFCFLVLLYSCQPKYGIDPQDYEEYLEDYSVNPEMEFMSLSQMNGIKLDIRYATKRNFTGEIIYPSAEAYARKPVVERLKRIADSLSPFGYGLLIFDAYRPYSATVKFYEIYKDTNFVASPFQGSRHNRGCAIDLSLYELSTGKPLPQPTPFDDFSERAYPNYPGITEAAMFTRSTLREAMETHGFTVYETEWWHFDFNDWKNYPICDIPFDALKNHNN